MQLGRRTGNLARTSGGIRGIPMYEFDVAISFAGTEREYAQAIAKLAIANGLKVFLDELFQADLWGENLVEQLSDIYETRAKYCLIIVSNQYCDRIYTNIERRAALDRAIQSKNSYILPIMTDGSWVKGLPKATVALDLRRHSAIHITQLLIQKVTGTAPSKLKIPDGLRITRLPIATLSAVDLETHLIDLCAASRESGVRAFGCLIYDESSVEYRQLFVNRDYWEALDKASGPQFEVFCVKDVEEHGIDTNYIEMLTQASIQRSRDRGYYFSKILSEYFEEEKTRLAYPSFLLFLIEGRSISHCRLVPLRRSDVHAVFLRLQEMFQVIAAAIEDGEKEHSGVSSLWCNIKDKLLEMKFTIYIQQARGPLTESVKSIVRFYDEEAAVE